MKFSGRCTNDVALSNLATIALRGKQKRSWAKLCATVCLRRPGCKGFTVDKKKKKCQFVGGTSCATPAFTSTSRNTNTYVTMQSDCFVETKSPTSRPVASCSVPTSNPAGVRFSFSALEGYPSGEEKFELIEPERTLCEMVRPKFGGVSTTISGYSCSLEACLRWCYYTDGCNYAQFSSADQTCVRATAMELTDDTTNFVDYFSSDVKTYSRKDKVSKVPYFSGACNELTPVTCTADPECAWNRGKRGYNDQLQGGSANGWCGRIKCNAAE